LISKVRGNPSLLASGKGEDMGYSRILAEHDMKNVRIVSVAAAAAIMLAGCGGGSHSGSGTSSGSGGSSAPAASAAPALDISHIQTAAARQIEGDHQGQVLQGQTHVRCPAVTSIEPKAGAKFECNVDAMSLKADSFNGKATIALNDAAGKTFSLDYTMSNMPLPGQGPKLTLSGTDSSVS
jgi:hypothetical protein